MAWPYDPSFVPLASLMLSDISRPTCLRPFSSSDLENEPHVYSVAVRIFGYVANRRRSRSWTEGKRLEHPTDKFGEIRESVPADFLDRQGGRAKRAKRRK